MSVETRWAAESAVPENEYVINGELLEHGLNDECDESLGEFYRRNRDYLVDYAKGMTDGIRAEDLVHDAFARIMSAYKGKDKFQNNGSAVGLFTVTIRRLVYDEGRKRVRRNTAATKDEELQRHVDAIYMDQSRDPADDIVEMDSVNDLISNLSPAFQEVARMIYVDGLSYEECAERLSIPQATVRTRIHRLKAKLREHIEIHGY